jgi:putative transposase
VIIDYIERYKNVFGVEPICTALNSADVPIAPSTFYAARTWPPSARAVRDEELKPVIARVHKENYSVYGIRKMHAQLNREQVLAGCQAVARCTTARLMKDLGLRGISRAKGPRTTVPGTGPDTRKDLVKRAFTADRPDQLWVADITYVRTFSGWVYAAFVPDVYSRRVVGWQLSTSLRTDLALDALNMGLWTRAHDGHDTAALVHHSDRGVQTGLNLSSRSAIPNVSPRPAPSRPLGARATACTTTRWPRRSTHCSKPNWSATADLGKASTTSRSRPPSTSTGSTSVGSTGRSGSSHQSSTRPPIAAQPSPSSLLSGSWKSPSNPVLDRDLIIGKANASAIGTLVERTTGYTMLVHLPDGYKPAQVAPALAAKIQTLPAALRGSLTWDQGVDMRDWKQVRMATDMAIYFCDPHAPWQRGTNEYTNGLLRQYFPKGTDLSVHSAADLDWVAAELNDRPRKRLAFRKPIEEIKPLLLR